MKYPWRKPVRFRLVIVAMIALGVITLVGCDFDRNKADNPAVEGLKVPDDIESDQKDFWANNTEMSNQREYIYEGEVLTDMDGFGVNVVRKPASEIGEQYSYIMGIKNHKADVSFIKYDERGNVKETSLYIFDVDAETVEDLCGKSDVGNWSYIYSAITDLITGVEPVNYGAMYEESQRDQIN